MTDAEIAQVGRGVRLLPVTAGIVVLAYNLPGIEGELRLPRDVYPDIFLGKIKKWNDPRIVAANPALAGMNKTITTVVRRDGSGTTFAFTNHLSAVSAEWKDGPGTAKSIDWPGNSMTANFNSGVAQRVKITENSIGYMEFGFARRLGLPMATLQNAVGEFVAPSAASGEAVLAAGAVSSLPANLRLFLPDPPGAASYPIVTLSWLLLYGSYPDAAKGAALKQAVIWGLTEGQTMAEEMGYMPLPAAIVAKARAALEAIE